VAFAPNAALFGRKDYYADGSASMKFTFRLVYKPLRIRASASISMPQAIKKLNAERVVANMPKFQHARKILARSGWEFITLFRWLPIAFSWLNAP
jgi:hypothetical protein